MAKRVKGSKRGSVAKKGEGVNDLERLRELMGDHAFQVSGAMVALAMAVEEVLNQHNAQLLEEMRAVATEIFDSADEALRSSLSNVQ